MLRYLQDNRINDVAIVLTRWMGRSHIGPARFSIMENLVCDLVNKLDDPRSFKEMASNVVPCHLTTPKKVNFARLSRLVIDLFVRILRDILAFYYPRPDDLQQRIKGTTLEQKFKKDRDRILDGDSYEKCDVSLLCTLIRYTCDIRPPTITNRRKMEWGGDRIPSRDCTTLGDEIERIRIIRNNNGRNRNNTKVKKRQQDSECPEYDYFFKNIQGSAILPTVHAIDLRMQTEPTAFWRPGLQKWPPKLHNGNLQRQRK
uniref:Uncharacterized protein n=1 Tax=Magallana gigas TaxID=29159 RepID=K1S052_MAGGI